MHGHLNVKIGNIVEQEWILLRVTNTWLLKSPTLECLKINQLWTLMLWLTIYLYRLMIVGPCNIVILEE